GKGFGNIARPWLWPHSHETDGQVGLGTDRHAPGGEGVAKVIDSPLRRAGRSDGVGRIERDVDAESGLRARSGRGGTEAGGERCRGDAAGDGSGGLEELTAGNV